MSPRVHSSLSHCWVYSEHSREPRSSLAADQEQRFDRLRLGRQVHQPDGWLPPLRRGQAGLHHDQGLLHGTQEEGSHPQEGKVYQLSTSTILSRSGPKQFFSGFELIWVSYGSNLVVMELYNFCPLTSPVELGIKLVCCIKI